MKPRPFDIRSTCRRGCQLATFSLAITFVSSAALKVAEPDPAAAALLQLPVAATLDHATRLLLVDLSSLIEALLGGALLFNSHHRWLLRAGCLTSIALFVAHLWLGTVHDGSCGCFGAVPIPDGVTLTVLALGAISCARLSRCDPVHRPKRLARWGGALLIALMAVSPLVQRTPVPRGPESQLIHSHLGGDRITDGVIIVGSWNCPHCREAFERLSETNAPDKIYFVTRETDASSPSIATRVDSRSVPDQLWWSLLESAPPRVIRIRNGRIVRDGEAGSPSPTE